MKAKNKFLTTTILVLTTVCSTTVYATSISDTSSVPNASIFRGIHDCRKVNIEEQINMKELLEKDLSISGELNSPKILIIHSHPQESYITSKNGGKGNVVEVGSELEKILETNYKVSVLHLQGDNNQDLMNAYNRIESRVQKVLKEYPSIEVIIDIHRDMAMEPTEVVVNDESIAKINIINGISMDSDVGTIGSLEGYNNPYITENLSLSTQVKYASEEIAPDLIDSIIIQKYRYSLHMLPKSLMIDVGNNMDTIEAAKNALQPFSEILAEVLKLEKITD